MSRPSRSDIARSTSTITGMPRRTRLGAEIRAEFRAAALGEDGGAIVQQRLDVGQLTFHSSGSRKVTMVRSPVGSIITAEIGVTRPGMCTICLVSMPSCAILSKMYRLEVSLTSPIGPQTEARPPRRTMPIAALRALPPQISSKCGRVLLGAAPGNTGDAEGQVAHRHADAEDARRDFRRFVVKVHPGIRHAGSALPEPRSGVNDWSMTVPAMRPVAPPMHPAADQMMRDRERMRRKHAVGMLAAVHQGRLRRD